MRAYVSTIPSQSNVQLVTALNEFNHSVQRFPSVAEYEAARANYLEDIVVREAHVEDAITGNNLRIKDQTLHISTATEAQDNVRQIPTDWNVTDVRDLVGLLLVPSPSRSMGLHPAQPVLVRAGPGTGKTWMAKQAVFTLADRLLRGQASNDGIRLVPIVVFVQRIIYLLRESNSDGERKESKGGAREAKGGASAQGQQKMVRPPPRPAARAARPAARAPPSPAARAPPMLSSRRTRRARPLARCRFAQPPRSPRRLACCSSARSV